MMKKLLLLAALVVMLLAVSLIAACSDGGTTSEPVPKDPPVVAPDDPSPPVDPSEEDPFGEPSEGDPSGEDQDEDPDDEPVPPVEFTYTFLGADGSELFSDSVTEGDYIPDDVLVAPSVDHYTFVGWSVGGARVTFPYSPTEDTVFVALYEINVYDYAFVVNGEAELSGSAPALTELTISSAPSVECDHYEFEGWAVNGTVVELPYVLTGDVTFNAVFTPIEYKVIYHLGDMEGKVENDNPDTYTVADIEHVLSALEHPCYGECEWYLDKTFTGEPIEYIPKNGGDVHLYAKWSDPHHFYNEDHVCTVCEEQAEQKGHVFEDSHECTICSFIAANHDYVNGKCVMCGKPCLHEKYDESHHCAECDMPAETLGHEYDTSHKCTICGHEHETRHHVYDNDYLCTICRVAHADHDYGEDHFCEICGRPYGSAEHEYENGVCTVCGKSEVWDGSIADGFSAGSGTAEDPYIIASASELAYLAKLTNEGECSADMYFALGTDIRLGGRSWTPIGKGYTTTEREVVDSAFRGHFDGRGHTVYGLVVNADESAAQEDTEAGRAFACAGLFGAVMGGETNAEVKNLRVSGYEIKFTAAAKDISVNVGGLIGTAHKATVYCCAADGVIEIRTGGDVRAGGLLGGVEDDNRYGSVSACTSDCTITVYAGGVSHVGGMAGYAGFGRFTDCAAFSVIEVECAETVVAGFATGTNAKTVINECFAQTDITCSAGTTDVFAIGCKTGSSFFGDGLVNGIPVGSGCDGVSAGDIAEAVASFGSSGLVPTNGTALPYTFAENASVPDDHEHVYNASHECMVCGKPHEISEHSFIGSHECTVCGFIAVEHNYDPETGKCTMCGEECAHDYDSGVCTVCGYRHTDHRYNPAHICEICGIEHETPGHVYENGSCTICDHEHSPHEYEGSHTCKVCGYTDTSGHVFDSETGICTVCGDACKHEYENGVCTICDYEHTVHNYEGSHVCTVCGYTATDHDYDAATGKCTMCGEECAHDFAGSHVCTVCGYTVTVHDYDAATGKCTMCGEECTHDYDGGTCTVCGYKHTAHKYTAEHICETCGIAYETPEHDYENGVCTICTHEHSPHEYEGSHTCKICGYADTSGHTYDPTTGVCTVCGDACKHDYDNGKCTICGYEHVEHNFENSHICTVCGYTVTDHDYDAATGKCTMCGEECAHDYDDGACTICGYKHTAHDYDTAHICEVCGIAHESPEHVYKNGVCTICSDKHSPHEYEGSHTCKVCGYTDTSGHAYDPTTGVCAVCGDACKHDYDNGKCTICGNEHIEHNFENSHICTVCGYIVTAHDYDATTGKCIMCGEECTHDFADSHVCTVCGYTVTVHDYDAATGKCTMCGEECTHDFAGSHVCTVCGYTVTTHDYDATTGKCTMCGEECAHDFAGSHVCTVCGYTVTAHDYDAATGKCTMCGEECTHDFAGSHVCTVCGYTVTAHDYDATTGKCIMCGEECVHDYDGGTCTVCGYKHTAHDYDTAHICKVCGIAYETPEHVYKNGVCTICGDKHSPHEYEGSHTCKVCGYTDTSGHAFDPETGICTVCGEVCKHEYENGVCTVCGATEKWDGTPAESFGGGSGTESDPYIISNAAELAYLAEFTAAGKAVYGTCFSLTADIDLCGNEWTPIGSGYYTESVYADRAFGGTFKGNGHTIRGLVITSAEFEYNGETGRDHASVGLFGAVCGKGTEYAVIQGLTVENAVITLSVSEKDSQTAVGILAGMASSVIMEDCVVSGSITVTTSGRADVGGLIGGIINSNRYGDINGCAADTVMELTAGDELYAGGLVGKASYGKMTGSSAECEINAEGTRMSVAGFAVNYGKYKTKAESCHSFAVITVPDGRNIKCDVFMPGGGDVDSCTYSALSAVNGEAAASSSGAVAV